MRTLLAALVTAVGLVAVAPPPADACSIRGRWCGYPAWAANAFEDPWGRVVLGSGPNLPQVNGYRYGYEPPRKRYGARYHYRRQKR